jgi:hypothetical protein
MSNRSLITFGARFLVLSLIFGIFGIFNTGSTLAAKNRGEETWTTNAQDGSSQLSGQLIATGTVTVNGNKAITGTTVFTDSNIVVEPTKGNSAVVNLGKLGRIELVAGTKLLLQFSEGRISGNLEEGQAIVNVPDGVKVAINTPNNAQTPSGQEPVKVITVHDTIAVPAVSSAPAPAPVPVPIPVSRGLSGWAIGGIVAGAGGVAAAAAIAADDDNDVVVTVASPTTP